jgi:hypothetical protein
MSYQIIKLINNLIMQDINRGELKSSIDLRVLYGTKEGEGGGCDLT